MAQMHTAATNSTALLGWHLLLFPLYHVRSVIWIVAQKQAAQNSVSIGVLGCFSSDKQIRR
ncbi:MAG TPA: hypothetical protein DCQ17_02905 [Firmicutes bacterium]|nr:hypothetical protein [Bacillota bacterium]